MVGVDILKVPITSKGNQYLLVAQDYFSKWPFSIALPDQKAATIVRVLTVKCNLWEMVEANMTEAAERQKKNYPGQNMATYVVGQKVLLDDPARGKLDPHWTGSWEVISVKGPLTLELQMGSTKPIVHVNRVRPLLVGDADRSSPLRRWLPPLFTHHESSVPAQDSETTQNSETAQDTQVSENPVGHHHTVTRSGQVVRHPDYYGQSGNT